MRTLVTLSLLLLGAVARADGLGVTASELTPELRRFFGAPADAGVVVETVAKESAAERAGVRVGDVIVEIKGTAGTHDASDLVVRGAWRPTAIVLVRAHRTLTLAIPPSVVVVKELYDDPRALRDGRLVAPRPPIVVPPPRPPVVSPPPRVNDRVNSDLAPFP